MKLSHTEFLEVIYDREIGRVHGQQHNRLLLDSVGQLAVDLSKLLAVALTPDESLFVGGVRGEFQAMRNFTPEEVATRAREIAYRVHKELLNEGFAVKTPPYHELLEDQDRQPSPYSLPLGTPHGKTGDNS